MILPHPIVSRLIIIAAVASISTPVGGNPQPKAIPAFASAVTQPVSRPMPTPTPTFSTEHQTTLTCAMKTGEGAAPAWSCPGISAPGTEAMLVWRSSGMK